MTLKDDEQNRVPKFKIRAEHLDELKTIADAKGILQPCTARGSNTLSLSQA